MPTVSTVTLVPQRVTSDSPKRYSQEFQEIDSPNRNKVGSKKSTYQKPYGPYESAKRIKLLDVLPTAWKATICGNRAIVLLGFIVI